MPKHKEDAPTATGKTESTDTLSAYLHMKSPLLGNLEFDASIPEPPVDGHLLSYEINHEAIAYEPSALELFDGCTTFREFQNGVVCDTNDNMNRNTYAVANEQLMAELTAELQTLDAAGHDKLTELRDETMGDPAMQVLNPLIARASEGLPEDVMQVLFAGDGSRFESKEVDRLPIPHKQSATSDHGDKLRQKWSSMTTSERVEYHISQINDTFVRVNELRHPTNPHAKIAKHYKVMPNVGLWKNRYIQAGVDGITSSTATEHAGKLAIGGILNVAKDGATQRIYEYYKSTEDSEDRDLYKEINSQERFKFVRMYSCQQSTKVEGNDNYYLLSLPPRLHNKVRSRVSNSNSGPSQNDAMDVDPSDNDVDESAVHILSVKGHKMVLTKAGKARRTDIVLTYTEEESPGHS
ncbi:uncharacterized protein BXIN_0981 [Babesia sp. Xinjiang]|uniref:uncharacterized protein n=1 Tax=Babesia sp. Xinjiang TaxID=462227 RepID=UPI000A257C59|nr:uncharacterized protein BXIN_0981 [Babesia sp. Xinjiang]ORM42227.1 hypothetical protein BXIN_0981 [Babesia sp. Xinjiang]